MPPISAHSQRCVSILFSGLLLWVAVLVVGLIPFVYATGTCDPNPLVRAQQLLSLRPGDRIHLRFNLQPGEPNSEFRSDLFTVLEVGSNRLRVIGSQIYDVPISSVHEIGDRASRVDPEAALARHLNHFYSGQAVVFRRNPPAPESAAPGTRVRRRIGPMPSLKGLFVRVENGVAIFRMATRGTRKEIPLNEIDLTSIQLAYPYYRSTRIQDYAGVRYQADFGFIAAARAQPPSRGNAEYRQTSRSLIDAAIARDCGAGQRVVVRFIGESGVQRSLIGWVLDAGSDHLTIFESGQIHQVSVRYINDVESIGEHIEPTLALQRWFDGQTYGERVVFQRRQDPEVQFAYFERVDGDVAIFQTRRGVERVPLAEIRAGTLGNVHDYVMRNGSPTVRRELEEAYRFGVTHASALAPGYASPWGTTPPRWHLGNLGEGWPPVGTVYRQELSFRHGLFAGHRDLEFYPRLGDRFVVYEVHQEGNFFALMDGLGSIRYFRRIPESSHFSFVEIRPSDWPWGATRRNYEPVANSQWEALRNRSPVSSAEVNRLSERLTRQQLEGSDTAHTPDRVDTVRRRLTRNLRQVNQFALTKVSSADGLSADDVQTLNRMLQNGFNAGDTASSETGEEGTFDDQHLAGIFRGTQVGDVDLRELHLFAEPNLRFVPAGEVPARIAAWIPRLNAVSRSTSMAEIIGIYRDFVMIHPFSGGNGRTARVLLDWMLLRAGFPPLPHSSELRRLFYREIASIEADFYAAYGAQRGR